MFVAARQHTLNLDNQLINLFSKPEPDLLTPLAYARSFGVPTDLLVADLLDLPEKPQKIKKQRIST